MGRPRKPEYIRKQASFILGHIACLARVFGRGDIAPLELARNKVGGAGACDEFGCVLFEECYRVEREIGVGGEGLGAPWDYHWGEGFVGLEPGFAEWAGDGDEEGLEVLAGGDEVGFLEEGGEGAGGEVAAMGEGVSVGWGSRGRRGEEGRGEGE